MLPNISGDVGPHGSTVRTVGANLTPMTHSGLCYVNNMRNSYSNWGLKPTYSVWGPHIGTHYSTHLSTCCGWLRNPAPAGRCLTFHYPIVLVNSNISLTWIKAVVPCCFVRPRPRQDTRRSQGHLGMISLIHHHFPWGRSEVAITYPALCSMFYSCQCFICGARFRNHPQTITLGSDQLSPN